jgi:hypothetical protein
MEFRPIQEQALAEPLILRVRSHGLRPTDSPVPLHGEFGTHRTIPGRSEVLSLDGQAEKVAELGKHRRPRMGPVSGDQEGPNGCAQEGHYTRWEVSGLRRAEAEAHMRG